MNLDINCGWAVRVGDCCRKNSSPAFFISTGYDTDYKETNEITLSV